MKDFFGCGRTRDAKGNVEGWHLNPYVNCIHTLVGHSRLNMEILIAELDMIEIKNIGQISSSQNSRVIFEGVEAKVKQIGNLVDDSSGGREPKIATSYCIRKLTPRECFRLMGVTEADIDKIQQSGVSQSQQYRMAGNSIVVDVLEHIFRKMFVDKGQESQQLSLF